MEQYALVIFKNLLLIPSIPQDEVSFKWSIIAWSPALVKTIGSIGKWFQGSSSGRKSVFMVDETEWTNVLLSTSEDRLLGIRTPEGVDKEILLVSSPLTVVQKRLGFF